MLFIAGDFNAKIETMESIYSFYSVTNRNRQQLTDFIDQFDLTTTNTRFKKHPGKLLTHIYPNPAMAQIDYILAKKKVYAVKVYDRFQTLMNLQIYHVKVDIAISSKQTMKWHLKSYRRREITKVFLERIKTSREQEKS